ncbi:alpha/beta fold hydrolase [Synechococcus sp. MIT S9509]|uniref:alpha/beta fold hydrolase n=1 Tax=Synechococcus sp. MIT S9509 TaxID=1801630 RepID=UPI001E4F8953|nr:alpha/beta hydrolase [Synechococcus sp. MIT S9509]
MLCSFKIIEMVQHMPQDKVLWIDLQPTLHCLNKRVAQLLSRSFAVQRWSFQHDLDESCSVTTVLDLLRQTLVASSEPMHLVGHGISGTVACLFAEKYPSLVKSLTLLSVDTLSVNHWSSHYLDLRSQLPTSRQAILSHLSSLLFSSNNARTGEILPCLLAKCLDTEFIQGSIVNQQTTKNLHAPEVPTFVLNGEFDFVVDSNAHDRWSETLKSGDRYVCMKKGRHFFQFDQAQQVADLIIAFIQMVPGEWINRELNANDFTSLAWS